MMLSFRKSQVPRILCSLGLFLFLNSTAKAYFIDGHGHYGVRALTITEPAASRDRGTHKAWEQTFRLGTEFRGGDNTSFFLDFRLFDDPRKAYMGDKSLPRDCNGTSTNTDTNNCPEDHQNILEPGYEWIYPKVTKFYAQYASEYGIFKVGRRPRDWGLGILLDSGEKPFSIASSTFDGVSWDINFQKYQDLSFSLGFDKLAEKGKKIEGGANPTFGPSNNADDLNQIYASVKLDDRKSTPNSFFNKEIGIYAANITSGRSSKGGSNTEVSLADLYLAFYFPRVTFRNEFLFRLGKSSDPNLQALGGLETSSSGDPAKNKISAMGSAGSLEFLLSGYREDLSETPYMEMLASRHLLFLDYAFAPGDQDGYLNSDDPTNAASKTNRDETAKAVAFHPNYKPALILFNGRPETDELNTDGVYNSRLLMNAQAYALGYRYEGLGFGNLEVKAITAFLNQDPSDIAKTYHQSRSSKPIGFYGKDLGYELDLKYWKKLSGGIELGLAGAALFSGKAWQVEDDKSPRNSYLLQANFIYSF